MNKTQDLPWDNPRFRNWIALVRAEKAVVAALTRALQPLDLKIAQLDMLMNLYRHPGMSQHDLARKLLVGRSNITMLLPQMEQRGFLTRENDAKDKRVMRLTLTADGEALLMEALHVYSGLIERVMAQSSPAQCDAMGAMMTRITDVMKTD
jgi:DNA-binding MarR family transcriptional regulator